MDGDGHLIEITARAGTRAVVTGQSATRVHPAVASYATQQWAVEVEDDACLVVLPGPTIPFRGSRYFQRGRVELAPRARLIWGDIWLPGRYDRGELSERFQFERIVQDFEARRAGRLVYRDRFRWDGPWTAEDADWYFGGALASASLFVAGPVPEALAERRPGVSALGLPARLRRKLHAMVRPPGGRHRRPGADRPAPGRELDRRARCPSLAPRLERPRPQPLVLDPGRDRPRDGDQICRDSDAAASPSTRPISELDQEADPAGQLAAIGVGAVDAEGGCTGEVTADLRADLEALDGVPVEPKGHLGVVGVDSRFECP